MMESFAFQMDMQRRHQQAAQSVNRQTAAMTFCQNNVAGLARAAIAAIGQKGYEITGLDKAPLDYQGTRHLSWELLQWPPHDLPPGVRSYRVCILDNALLVAETVHWRGGTTILPYDPTLHATPSLNVQSLYVMLARLPRDHSFLKRHMDQIPA